MKKVTLTLCAILLYTIVFAQSKSKKNILFILADDLQNNAIKALGHNQVITPNIDNIVRSGTSFVNTYTNGSISGALSMPSRAMLMTGRGVFEINRDGQVIPEQHATLPEQLRTNGYATFATGKWHSDRASFNRSFADGENIFFGGMHQYQDNGHVAPRLVHYDPSGEYKEKPFIGEKFSSEMYADAAVDFINRKHKQPFFAYVAFTSPHDPRNQHPTYGVKYNPDEIELPINYLPQHPFNNGDHDVRDEVYLPLPRTKEGVRKELADYYGMISELDVQVGRIIDALKKSGQYENTIIVFAADNGLAVGQHGLLGKQNLYDHSVKVPLTIVAPGIDKNKKTGAYCYLYDVYPTLCEMVGVKPASSVKGKSLLPVLNGDPKVRDNVYLAYSSIQRAIVKDSWKYIIYNIGGFITEQLFDLGNDPWEMVNYANDEKYAMKKAAYKQLLMDEMKKGNDFCDLNKPDWWGKPHRVTWEEGLELYNFSK